MLRLRNRHFLLFDAILLLVIPFAALTLRVDRAAWSEGYRAALLLFTVLALAIKLPLFYFFGLYRRYWRYASVNELFTIVFAVGLATAILTALVLAARYFGWFPGRGLPRSVPLIDGMLTLIVVGGARFSVRAVESARRVRTRNGKSEKNAPARKRVLVVGAGDAGEMIVREMRNSGRTNLEPVGFADDDQSKQGVMIHGIPVLGTRKHIPDLVAAYDVQEVVIAMPTAPGTVIREIVALCEAAQVPSRTMPGIYELLSGHVSINQLRNVEIEDLLRRDPVQIDSENVARMLSGMGVLVTGAGGSIGSELCRQIASCRPARLILLGHGENSLFTIENELRPKWPHLALDVVVADIRDQPRLQAIFERVRPQVIFHAAAHKHVPLMETNSEDAVSNNVGGTRVLVQLSERYRAERFVLISSDKAVNPVNVMGATKRVAELLVQAAGYRTGRPFVSVRFGNVLDSRGSVVPLFRQQIAQGGPVTVTHPEMQRYFMTIPEAVQLVLQSAALGQSGEVFVLDMGQPVKVVDLARDLIHLSGLELGRDINIVFTGLRPGEKLFEELFVDAEEYSRTKHEKIFVARDGYFQPEAPLPDSPSANGGGQTPMLEHRLENLILAARRGRPDEVQHWLKEIVPEYNPAPPDGAAPAAETTGAAVHPQAAHV